MVKKVLRSWTHVNGKRYWGRKAVGEESIGKVKSPQRMKAGQDNKTTRTSDNLSKKCLYSKGGGGMYITINNIFVTFS